MKGRFLILFFSIFCGAFAKAQKVYVAFEPLYSSKVISLADSSFNTNDSNKLQIDVLKFYISNIQLLNKGKVIYTEKISFHLIDVSKLNSLQFILPIKKNVKYDELKCTLGIDSATNVSGAMGGDLDPTKGMYWTWQSGYINFKLEGKSLLCTTRNNEFAFHVGGYKQPMYPLQQLSFAIKNTEQILIQFDVNQIFSKLDLATKNHIMSPSNDAVLIAKIVANAFQILSK